MVLLKNERDVLPLNLSQPGQRILFLAYADQAFNPKTSGGGSSEVTSRAISEPVNALAQRLGVDLKFEKDKLPEYR